MSDRCAYDSDRLEFVVVRGELGTGYAVCGWCIDGCNSSCEVVCVGHAAACMWVEPEVSCGCSVVELDPCLKASGSPVVYYSPNDCNEEESTVKGPACGDGDDVLSASPGYADLVDFGPDLFGADESMVSVTVASDCYVVVSGKLRPSAVEFESIDNPGNINNVFGMSVVSGCVDVVTGAASECTVCEDARLMMTSAVVDSDVLGS